MFLSILAFILTLGILVFVHELGHFLVAKWTGMRVDEFAIGFPPRLWGKKVGETTYAINALPLGGYVKIFGENPEEGGEDNRSFQKKPVWARMAVISAGVLMNLLFAFLVLTIAFSVGFVSSGQQLEKIPGATVKDSQVIIMSALPDSPAAKAGIEPGDIVKEVTDPATNTVTDVKSIEQLQTITRTKQAAEQRELKLEVDRNGQEKQISLQLSPSGPPLGVAIQAISTVKIPLWRAPQAAATEVWLITETTWGALKGFAGKLFTQAKLDETVSGPVGIYQATSAAAHQGIIPIVFLTVVLSVNLALLNMLPIPALDGGRMVFLIIEAIFRKRVVAERIENWVTFTGLVALLSLIFLITIKDIIRLF